MLGFPLEDVRLAATPASATSAVHHNKMGSGLHVIVVLCLTIGLQIGANVASASDQVCKTCPSGWTQFEDNCFKYHRGPKDWADAELMCMSIGGNLASIPNQGVLDFINEMIQTVIAVNSGTWIGGQDSTKEGVFLWSDGSPFEFTSWAPGEPNNSRGQENCVAINFKNLFNDVPCGIRKPYVCSRKL